MVRSLTRLRSKATARQTPVGTKGIFIGAFQQLRDGENYGQKWQYVRENPVRAGLVERPEDWPYFGRVHEIRWSGD